MCKFKPQVQSDDAGEKKRIHSCFWNNLARYCPNLTLTACKLNRTCSHGLESRMILGDAVVGSDICLTRSAWAISRFASRPVFFFFSLISYIFN